MYCAQHGNMLDILFVSALRVSQQFSSHVGAISCLLKFKQYFAEDKVSCSRTQRHAFGKYRTSNHLISSQTLYAPELIFKVSKLSLKKDCNPVHNMYHMPHILSETLFTNSIKINSIKMCMCTHVIASLWRSQIG